MNVWIANVVDVVDVICDSMMNNGHLQGKKLEEMCSKSTSTSEFTIQSRYSAKKKFFKVMFIIITSLASMCFINNCGSSGSLSGGLRGNRLLILQISHYNSGVEFIEVYKDKSVIRAPAGVTDIGAISNVQLPEILYNDLDDLRQKWCTNSPSLQNSSKSVSHDLSTYRIAIQCGRLVNPEFTLLPDQIPQPITQLIEAVPPSPSNVIP